MRGEPRGSAFLQIPVTGYTIICDTLQRMYMSQGQVAILNRVYQDTVGDEIMNLTQFISTLLQFTIDTGKMFLPEMHFRMNIRLAHLFSQRLADLIDSRLTLANLFFHFPRKTDIFLWFQVTESQVLQFRLH